MSFVFKWFWSTKKVDAKEEERATQLQRALMQELNGYLKDHKVAEKAERGIDFAAAYDLLCDDMDAVNAIYKTLDLSGRIIMFPNEETRLRLFKAIEKYLDRVLEHREIVEKNEILRRTLAQKLLNYPVREGFYYDAHYWHFFRRHLSEDVRNPAAALKAIEATYDSDDEFSTTNDSSDEEEITVAPVTKEVSAQVNDDDTSSEEYYIPKNR